MALFRAVATVGGLTGVSRILGYARDMLIATTLGTGPVADAFFVAFRFPNLFRRVFGEGAFNAAFVPLFSRRLETQGQAAAEAFAEEAMSLLMATLLVFSVVAMAAMPWIMLVLAPGFSEDPDKFDLAVRLTRITTPYLLFMALFALLAGALNALYKFAAPAAAQLLLNVVLIVAMAAVAPFTGEAGLVLATAVTVGGLVQFAALIWAARRAGLRLALPRPRLSPDMRELIRLMVPGVLAAGVVQINLVVGSIIASMEPGAVSYLYYADRLQQLPLGLIGVAFGVVLLPDLSRRLRAEGEASVMHGLNRGIEASMLLSVPAAVALAAIPLPMVVVLFEHGAFDRMASLATAQALAAYALGVPGFVLVRVLQPAFFAREDTRTPLKAAVAAMATNVTVALALFWWIGFLGVALAASLAAWVNAGMLAALLARRGQLATDQRLRRRLPAIVATSLVLGVALWLAADLGTAWLDRSIAWQIALLAGLVLGGIALYAGLGLVLGAARIDELRATMRRPRRAKPQTPEAP